jgi:hypothetical protein
MDVENSEAFSVSGADSTVPGADTPKNDGRERDDDELVRSANDKIAEWQVTPSLTQVQELFHLSICAGASPMARDKIVAAIFAAFGAELGGKRALGSTWNQIAKQSAAECAREMRGGTKQAALTSAEKAKRQEALWPTVSDLAQAPDLIDRVVQQVQAIGVVNERELITLTYLAATSRILKHPVNLLVKGASSGGKSFTATRTLEL